MPALRGRGRGCWLCALPGVHRAGKLNKPAAQLDWVLLMEQMRAFTGRFNRDQVKEDPVTCEIAGHTPSLDSSLESHTH